MTLTQEFETNFATKKTKLNLGKTAKRKGDQPILWYDLEGRKGTDDLTILTRLSNTSYSGVVLSSLEELEKFNPYISPKLIKVLKFDSVEKFELFASMELVKADNENKWIICSSDIKLLESAKKRKFSTCLYYYIDDNDTLHQAIELGQLHPYLMMCFKDPTNIPLELVIASLQFSETKVIKEIQNPEAFEDAVVSLDTMEVGADGVVFSPHRHDFLEAFLKKLDTAFNKSLKLEIGEITKSIPVGIGHRACIDLVTMFKKNEGILVGSTSSGGLLCCPEVFPMPYMDLRPFRINAGGVHSYVYTCDNKTNYITELKAGDTAMVVDLSGNVRQAVVGRVKIEVRPLRLIEAKFGNTFLNILLQDDWHVRIYSSEGLPLNISELKIGQKVLGYLSTPGRHVGIQVEENILEK